MRYFLSLILLFPLFLFSQEKCELPEDGKVKKLYVKAMDRRKTKDSQKRLEYMKQAIEEDESCVPCYWELAKRSYSSAKYSNSSFDKAIEYYKQVENLCPSYHSDIYYYLGLIYYQKAESKLAEEYFKKFVEFRDQDEFKFEKNYLEKLGAAKKVLPELNFKNTFFNNPVPFKPMLVKNVSTTGEEYLPMISADDENLFYTRVYTKKGLGDIVSTRVEELVISKRNTTKENFDNGTALPKPFNIGQNYGGVSISINNKELYLCACEMLNGYNNCDIFVSNYEYIQDKKTGKNFYKWTEMKNLGSAINSSTTWEAQPSISADGQTLYFATSRPTSEGIDIYYSERNEEGEWGKAKSMGSTINSSGNDKAPFMHTDSRTMYFASQIQEDRRGAGDYDIFYTKQDDNGKWSEPKNIGYPINSAKAEDGLIVNITGETAYFSSGGIKGGMGGKDIYSFELPDESKPEKVVLMKGKLIDKQGNPVTDAKLSLNYEDKSKNKEIDIVSDDGNFAVAINMEKDKKVAVTLNKEGAAYQSRLIKEEDAEGGVIKKKDIEVKELEIGESFEINDIKFATNSSELDENAQFILDDFILYLTTNSSIKFKIVGHTDNVGNDSENQQLSANRANSVKDYLIQKGVKSSRVKSEGKGESQPKVPNISEENKQINRRTEIIVMSK
jgi:outer membrane protein OmpA-like peptidoglycan-associated protein/tetratricopeptide (TPR) repeat protein